MHGLETEYWGQVNFVYLDREDPANIQWVNQLGIRYQPEFYLLDANNDVVQVWIGYVTIDALRASIDQLLASS